MEWLLTLIDMKNSFYAATQAWESKKLKTTEKIKLGRNNEVVLGPQSLKGVTRHSDPVKPVCTVFNDDGSSHVDNLAYNATRCAIYSTHERLCLTMGEYKVARSSSSGAIAMTSACTKLIIVQKQWFGYPWFSKQFCTKIY